MDLNFNFSKAGSITDEYLVLVSFGKLVLNRSNRLPLREVFFINSPNPFIGLSSSLSSDCIKILQIPDHQTSHHRTGMVFNSDGGYNENLSHQRKSRHKTKTLNIKHERDYRTKGINKLIAHSIIPKYIVNHHKQCGFDSSFYLVSEASTKVKAIIPNALILRYFYFINEALSLLLLNRQFDKIIYQKIQTNNYNLVLKDNKLIDTFLVRHYVKYLFAAGNNLNTTDIQLAINSYYRDLLNADGNTNREPNDILAKIPFNNKLKITLEGEMISENKFLAYDIISLTPHSNNEHLYSPLPLYILDLQNNQNEFTSSHQNSNTKLKISLERKGFVHKNHAEYKSHSNHFLDSPLCHIIQPSSIDYVLFKDFIGSDKCYNIYNKVDLRKDETIIRNDDQEHFKTTTTALTKIDIDHKYLTIGNLDGESFSFIQFPKQAAYKIDIKLKVLLAKITYKGIEFLLVDAGAEFPIGFLKNTGKSIRTNSKRLTNLITYISNNYRFNWQVLYQPHNYYHPKKSVHSCILEKYNFMVLEPIYLNPSLIDEELIEQLQRIIKVRIYKNFNALVYK